MSWIINFERTRLAAIFVVCLPMTFLIATFCANFVGVEISTMRWGVIVLFQFAFQLIAAVIGDYASGGKDDIKSSALAILGLSLGTFVAVAEIPISNFGAHELATLRTQSTLLGAIACTTEPDQCVNTFNFIATASAVILLGLCCASALLIRKRISIEENKPNAIAIIVFFIGSLSHSFWFLLIHPWAGIISWHPDNMTNNVALGADFTVSYVLLFTAVAISSLTVTCSLQSYAMYILVRKQWKISPPKLSTEYIPALIDLARTSAKFLRDILLLLGGAIVLTSTLVAMFVGISHFFDVVTFIFGLVIVSFAEGSVAINTGSKEISAGISRVAPLSIGPLLFILKWFGILFVTSLIVASANQAAKSETAIEWVRGFARFAINVIISLVRLIVSTATQRPRTSVLLLLALAGYFILDNSPQLETPPPTETIFAHEPSWIIDRPKFADQVSFHRGTLNCGGTGIGSFPEWEYSSSSRLAHALTDCEISPQNSPYSAIFIGSASRDDSPAAGYQLSIKRAKALSELVKNRQPDAKLVCVALGRHRGLQSYPFRTLEMFSPDRRVSVHYSTDHLPLLFEQKPITELVLEQLHDYQENFGYETCSVFFCDEADRLPKRKVFGPENTCEWIASDR